MELGALLHDIGRCRTHGIQHAAAGGLILRILGFDEKVARIAERHMGAGVPPDEAEALELPPGEYMPATLEEKIVCHADNLVRGAERVEVQDTVDRFMERGLRPQAERIRALHGELSSLAGGDL